MALSLMNCCVSSALPRRARVLTDATRRSDVNTVHRNEGVCETPRARTHHSDLRRPKSAVLQRRQHDSHVHIKKVSKQGTIAQSKLIAPDNRRSTTRLYLP